MKLVKNVSLYILSGSLRYSKCSFLGHQNKEIIIINITEATKVCSCAGVYVL